MLIPIKNHKYRFSYIHTGVHIVCFLYTLSLKVVLCPNKYMNIIFAYNMLSLTIHLYIFDLSFLKIILEGLCMGFYSAKYTCCYL